MVLLTLDMCLFSRVVAEFGDLEVVFRPETQSRLNRDGGYELPGCWIATMKKLGGRANRAGANHVGASASTSALGRTSAQAQHPRL